MLTSSVVRGCVLSLLWGCGSGSPPSGLAEPHSSDLITGADCHIVLTPHDALREATAEWAARWGGALDCRVELGAGGLPIELVARVQRPDGSDAPGATGEARDYVHISARAGQAQQRRSLGHELGHLLGGEHTESDGVLSGEPGRRDVIDTEATLSVCSRLPCGVMSPEAP